MREHSLEGTNCWCKPSVVDGIVVHNSEDGREYYEQRMARIEEMLLYLRLPLENALAANPNAFATRPPSNIKVEWYTGADTVAELLELIRGKADFDC